MKNYNFYIKDITIEELKKLLKCESRSIKDLHNYNRLNIFQVNKKSYVRIWQTNNITLGSMDYFMKLKDTFWHKQFIIFTDSFLFAWNGYGFTSADIRTSINLKDFYRVQDIKKAIATANKNNKTFYIIQECEIKYNSFWYDNIYHRRIEKNERVNLKELKYYYNNYPYTEDVCIYGELKNGCKIYLNDTVYKKDLYKHIDKSGYQLDFKHDYYKKYKINKNRNIDFFVNDFIKNANYNYFNIEDQLCYSSTALKEYFILKMQELKLKYTITSYFEIVAESEKYIFNWCERSFIIVMKKQQYKKIFKYELNKIKYELIIKSDLDINNSIIESIKNMIHNNKLCIYESNYSGLVACDTHIYNTCYDMMNIKFNPTFTEDDKIIACEIEFNLYKNDEIVKEEKPNKTKILFNAILN